MHDLIWHDHTGPTDCNGELTYHIVLCTSCRRSDILNVRRLCRLTAAVLRNATLERPYRQRAKQPVVAPKFEPCNVSDVFMLLGMVNQSH